MTKNYWLILFCTSTLAFCRHDTDATRIKFTNCMQACKEEPTQQAQCTCQNICKENRCKRRCSEQHACACKNSKGCQRLAQCIQNKEMSQQECHAKYIKGCLQEEACQEKNRCLVTCSQE